MNKRITAAVLAAALTVSATALAGCNSNEKTTSSQDSKAASTPSSTAASSDNNEKRALEKTSFNLGHLNSTAHLLGFVAKEEGYFQEE